MTRGNVLLVANYASNVGYAWWLMESYWVAIADYCATQGRKAFLIYPTVNKVSHTVRNSSIEVIEHNFLDNSPEGRNCLIEIIQAKGIDALYLTDKPYFSLQYFWLRRNGIRAIVNHDHKPGERPRQAGVRRLLKFVAARFTPWLCDLYIGVSRFVHDRFINVACLPPARCTYVYNGIHPIVIEPSLRDYAQKLFDLPGNRPIVVTTGRATFYKGIDFLIECADELINHRGSPAYFLHCGDGPDLDTFRSMVRERGFGERFLFAGHRTDLTSILQSCDIGIQASKGEAFSLSILEYMSAGLATVAPDNCGNGEAVDHGRTGLLYRPGDRESAVDALQGLIDDMGRRHALGEAGRLRVEKCFRIEDAQRGVVEKNRGVL